MFPTIKVLVVDDSAFMRHIVSKLLSQDPEIEVVGTAPDGEVALEKIRELSPHVVTLDVEMPRLDGLTTLAYLMNERPLPVVMLSAYTKEGADATIRALELGAVDFVTKPSGPNSPNIHRVAEVLLQKVKEAAQVDVRMLRHSTSKSQPFSPPDYQFVTPPQALPPKVVAIGCSSGGPHALRTIIPALPGDLPVPVLIVQHMPGGFTTSLATRLDEVSMVKVKEAEAQDKLQPGAVLVAPGDCDIRIGKEGRVQIVNGITAHRSRPSIDMAFESLAEVYGSLSLAVVLTGMGSDGARGAACIRRVGGSVIAEDKSTCIVYGMPRRVIEDGNANRILPLHDISRAIAEMVAH